MPWYIMGGRYYVYTNCRMLETIMRQVHERRPAVARTRNPGIKIKVFHPQKRYKHTLCYRFEKLYRHGYTHVVNMRGGPLHVLQKLAKIYRITLIDDRLPIAY